jgi:hypothetical protein
MTLVISFFFGVGTFADTLDVLSACRHQASHGLRPVSMPRTSKGAARMVRNECLFFFLFFFLLSRERKVSLTLRRLDERLERFQFAQSPSLVVLDGGGGGGDQYWIIYCWLLLRTFRNETEIRGGAICSERHLATMSDDVKM